MAVDRERCAKPPPASPGSARRGVPAAGAHLDPTAAGHHSPRRPTRVGRASQPLGRRLRLRRRAARRVRPGGRAALRPGPRGRGVMRDPGLLPTGEDRGTALRGWRSLVTVEPRHPAQRGARSRDLPQPDVIAEDRAGTAGHRPALRPAAPGRWAAARPRGAAPPRCRDGSRAHSAHRRRRAVEGHRSQRSDRQASGRRTAPRLATGRLRRELAAGPPPCGSRRCADPARRTVT